MYTPDGTEVRLGDISPAAGRLYLFYCRWRDHKTGYSRKGYDVAVVELKLSRATAYRAQRQLLDEDMILESEGRIGLRGGSFEPYDQTQAARRVWATPRAELPGERSLNFETDSENRLKIETENLNAETVCLKIETGAYKERARDYPSHSPSDLHHTPPTPSHAESDGSPPRGGGVCVLFRSRCSPEQIAAYARAFGLGLGWQKQARKTGVDDDWIEEFDRDPEGFIVAHAVRPPTPPAAMEARIAGGGDAGLRELTPVELEELAESVESLVEVQGREASAVITELRVTEADRERLRGRFGVDDGQVARVARAPP